MSDINDVPEDETWLVDMYADDPNAAENLAKKQAAMAHARSHIKRHSKDTIELHDDKGNKLMASSELYVRELEKKLARQQEIIKIQSSQISFLNSKFTSMQAEIAQLQDSMSFFNERF